MSKAIDVRGIPESHSNVCSSTQHFEVFFFAFARAVREGQSHPAKTNFN